MRIPTAALAALLLLAALATPTLSQSTATPPAFAVGANKSYCHAVDATNAVWMNTQMDDGDGVPYEFFGEPTATDPVLGAGLDPVLDEAFETRIPLSPALAQDLSIAGTVTVDAFIGGGTYTAGEASIATSLVAGGAVLGAAEAKDHQMSPAQSGQTYNAISWTFDVPSTEVPAGTLLEWVISGTASGNNVFLACHEARGRSSITLPVTAASALAGGVIEHELNGTTAKLNLSAAQPTNASHLYRWNTTLTAQQLRITTEDLAGNVTLAIVDGANATLRALNVTGNLTEALAGKPGNWTFTLGLESFTGNVTVEVGPVPPAPAPTPSGSSTQTATGSSTTSSGNATAKDDKDAPGPLLPALVGAVALVALLRRRRLA